MAHLEGRFLLRLPKGQRGGVEDCWFDGNDGTNEGDLYLSTGDTGESDERRFVQDSVFVNNVAGES